MEERKRARRDPARPADTLAEIQARLEMCEEDLEEMTRGDGHPTRRHSADLYEEVDEIELLLDELMTEDATGDALTGDAVLDAPGNPAGDERKDSAEAATDPYAVWSQDGFSPRWTPRLDAMYRDEEAHAAQLAQIEKERRRAAGTSSTSRQNAAKMPDNRNAS